MSEFSLRKDRPKAADRAPAPERVPSNFVQGMGNLPFAPGQGVATQVDPKTLTAQERKDLEAIGWRPGMAVPSGLAERVAAARAAVAADVEAGIEKMQASGHVLKPPKVVPIDQLPPERQAELRGHMQQAQETIHTDKLQRMHEQALMTMDPDIRKTLLQSENIEVYDSREDKKAPAVPPRPAADPKEVPGPGRQAEEAPAATGVDDGKCQHCGWPRAEAEQADATDADKLNYANAIWSGQPFLKDYYFFGRKVHVVFRALTVEQAEMAISQVAADQRKGRYFSASDLWERLMEYRTLLGILKVSVGGVTMDLARAVDEVLRSPEGAGYRVADGETVLPGLLKQVLAQPGLAQETIWRTLVNAWKRFSRLYEFLEARADDESFWAAVEN